MPKSKTVIAAQQFTTEPIKAVVDNLPKPEFLRVKQVEARYGIRRGTLYHMLQDGLIKGVSLRVRGTKQGCRLISTDSIDAYIAKMMRDQGVAQ